MFQTFISRHNSNFFSDKLVLTSVTPASSAPVLQTPKATSSRSEERFSRNAETDLVCRLLLEKKNRRSGTHPLTAVLSHPPLSLSPSSRPHTPVRLRTNDPRVNL